MDFTVTYPKPALDTFPNDAASSCDATIKLPENLGLAQGEQQKKTLNASTLAPGANDTVSWTLTANAIGQYAIGLGIEELISGSMGSNVNASYPAYSYTDRIGTSVNLTLDLREDNNPPMIEVPSRTPEPDVQPSQEVHVSVNATDLESGLQNVTLYYSLNNDSTWNPQSMDYNLTSHLYATTIPGQPGGTYVKFRIGAYDNAGNAAFKDGTEPDFAYQVASETQFDPTLLAIVTIIVLVVLLLIILRKRLFSKEMK